MITKGVGPRNLGSPIKQITSLGQSYRLSAENYADSVKVAKKKAKFEESLKPKMSKTVVPANKQKKS
tara:strand:- start:90 stop:290 length:201 start_codon:yes stop_codon:yes gene_type:complete